MPDDFDHHPLRVPGPDRQRRGATVAIALCAAAGAVFLFAGYWGVSDATTSGDQLPYFASATIPGLVLAVAAAVLVVRREHERDRDELRALSARFDAMIDWLAADGTDRPDQAPAGNGAVPRTVAER